MKHQNIIFISRQAGSAIVVCLMLLTIATLIAINSVSSTILGEKIAGNIKNKQISFQSAEAALRSAENAASMLTTLTPFDGSNGLYPVSNPGDVKGAAGVLADYPVWEDEVNTVWVELNSASGLSSTNPFPEYIIEKYSTADLFLGCSLDYAKAAECRRPMYRITARGEGANTVTILQSTFKQP